MIGTTIRGDELTDCATDKTVLTCSGFVLLADAGVTIGLTTSKLELEVEEHTVTLAGEGKDEFVNDELFSAELTIADDAAELIVGWKLLALAVVHKLGSVSEVIVRYVKDVVVLVLVVVMIIVIICVPSVAGVAGATLMFPADAEANVAGVFEVLICEESIDVTVAVLAVQSNVPDAMDLISSLIKNSTVQWKISLEIRGPIVVLIEPMTLLLHNTMAWKQLVQA